MATDVPVLPAESRATALRLWAPLVAPVVFQEIDQGAEVSSFPRLTPSSRNWTPATPTLSEALAVIVTVPVTELPAAGAVRVAVGEVVSVPPTRRCPGTFTRKASSRLPPALLVQMKYCPVTSRFPFGRCT